MPLNPPDVAAAKDETMPYRQCDLPISVRRHLAPHVQGIYREAFNHAFAAHAGESRQEEAAHRMPPSDLGFNLMPYSAIRVRIGHSDHDLELLSHAVTVSKRLRFTLIKIKQWLRYFCFESSSR